MNFVPETAAKVEASSDFELKHTTSGGVKIFIRELSKEEADSISMDSPDDEFLSYQEDKKRLMVIVKNNEIVTGPQENADDNLEIMDFMVENGL